MSEYQYYQFQAIERPLTDTQMEQLRDISTRAEITPTSFINEYHWSDLKADPLDFMKKYFDAHLYVANWGTRCLMLKVARDLVDVDLARRYCTEEALAVQVYRDSVILIFTSTDEYDEDWEAPQRWLPSLLSLRDDLARGDLRSLYFGWLAGIWEDDEELEPPLPAGLGQLSAPLRTLADFLRLDPHIIAAAIEEESGAPPAKPSQAEIADWVVRLGPAEKDALVAKLVQAGQHPAKEISDLRRRFQKQWNEANDSRMSTERRKIRTAAQIFQLGSTLAEEASRREAERITRVEEQKRRKAAEARKRYLEALAPKENKLWDEVTALLRTTNQKNYDQAVKWLCDLRDLEKLPSSVSDTWADRVTTFRAQFSRKSSLMKLFDKAGFP